MLSIQESGSYHNPSVRLMSFKDSHQAAIRRLTREAIRRGPFTKSGRDVALAIVNLWFHHRNGPKGFVHPGREFLAKKVRVSTKTVQRTLSILRQSGALEATAFSKGEGQNPTRYVVNLQRLFRHCGYVFPSNSQGELRLLKCQNVPPLSSKMSHHSGVKMSHSLKVRLDMHSQHLKLVGGNDA